MTAGSLREGEVENAHIFVVFFLRGMWPPFHLRDSESINQLRSGNWLEGYDSIMVHKVRFSFIKLGVLLVVEGPQWHAHLFLS